MRPLQLVREWSARYLDELRLHLSRPDALLMLAGLGILTGIAAGVLIVGFRLAIELPQSWMLPGGDPENYEALPPWQRLLLPTAGGVLIGLLLLTLGRGIQSVGVVHVMERLAYHQGHMRWRPLVLQFLGGAIAIISGQSVGREGPSVHLGGAAGSLIGRHLSLPNNSIRTMVGCGVAAAIAAAFNTPLAGVIFALEVVMLEYTLASFTPVVLAAVSATTVSVMVFGPDAAFEVPRFQLGSLYELPLVLVLGMVTGVIAAIFIQLVQSLTAASKDMHVLWRSALAGLGGGFAALAYPEVMGIGYDTVNSAMLGEIALGVLIGIVAFKTVATAIAIGMGIPGGLIGPTLVIGAALGGAAGLLAQPLLPDLGIDPGLYALLGMGAMMGATLQAPLAALTAILELTGNPGMIFPGMLAIVAAGLTCSELFGKRSVFVMLLGARGLDYRDDPVLQALRRVGVAGAMDRDFAEVAHRLTREQAEAALRDNPEWLLLRGPEDSRTLMTAVDLARLLAESEDEELDLLAIPGRRRQASAVQLQSTLQEALETLQRNGTQAAYVERITAPGVTRIYGVLTLEQIERHYRL